MSELDLPILVRGVVTVLLLLAGSVWLGGAVNIFVVGRSASATLASPERVAFFSGLGRRWGLIGTVALALALGCGVVLLLAAPWTAVSTWLVVVGAILITVLGLGIVQARQISRMRHIHADTPDTELAASIARRAPIALALRVMLVLLSALIVVLAVIRALTP